MKKYKNSYQKLFRATLATTVATGALVAAVPAMTTAAEAKSTSFSDVKEAHHFYESVMNLTARGVINGYEDGTYRPGENISRAHAAKIIALALGLDTKNVKNPGFEDVSESNPYYGHIAALVEAGIIKGYEDDTFKPNGNLTRAHIAQMLVLGFGFEQEKLSNLPFKDINGEQWFADYIQTLYSNEITTGTTATTFSPNAFVTRGQVASFIYRSELTQAKGSEVIGFANDKLELADGTYAVDASLQDVFNDANLPALKGALVKVTIENDTIVGVTSIELKANGTAANDVILDGNGSTLTSNVTVNGDYVSLKNVTVKGNLEIGQKVENSFATDKVTVTGKTIISDKTATAAVFSIAAVAKSPTIVFNNSTIGTVEVSKKGATVEAKGTTKVQEVVLSSNVTLKADAGITIPKVSVKTGAAQVTLDANVGSLNINSTGAFTLSGTGNIKDVKVESKKAVNFETKGKIEKLTVSSKDAKISLGADTRVADIVLPAGAAAQDVIQDYDKAKGQIDNIDGKANPDAKPEAPAAGGGGGGGSTGGGGGTPGVSFPGNALLNQNLQNQLDAGNSAADGAVSISLSGNTFTVSINDPAKSINKFESAGKDVFDVFKNKAVVNSTSVTLSGNTNSIVINRDNVNNNYSFDQVIGMALDLAQASGNTNLGYLVNKNMVITVTGTIDSQQFSDTYTFEFK